MDYDVLDVSAPRGMNVSENSTRVVSADDSGVFQFSGVPAGRFELQVEAAGFRPVAALPIVTIGEGARAEDLRLLMHAMGSISGVR